MTRVSVCRTLPDTLDVGHALLQCVYTIGIIEVIEGIETETLEALDRTDRLAYTDDVIVLRTQRGRSPVCSGISIDTFYKLVDIVVVVIVGSVEREVEVLRADDVVVDSELDTFVGGLTRSGTGKRNRWPR